MKFTFCLIVASAACALVLPSAWAQGIATPDTGAAAKFFVATAPGVVKDTRTGLEWMRCSLGQTWQETNQTCAGEIERHTFQSAQMAAKKLNETGGYAKKMEWRVPTGRELYSLLNCSAGFIDAKRGEELGDMPQRCANGSDSPTIAQRFFPEAARFYWSATLFSNPEFVWVADLHRGNVTAGELIYNETRNVVSVRLVRSDFHTSTEVACSKYKPISTSCNQCFDGQSIYQGQIISNALLGFTAGNQQTAIFAKDAGTVKTEVVQPGFLWSDFKAPWLLNSELFVNMSKSKEWYAALEPNQFVPNLMNASPDDNPQFISGPVIGGQRDIPSFKISYDIKFFTKESNFSKPEFHKTCVFYKANWCGDNIKDAKEDCDLGATNGKVGSVCSASCKLVN